MAGFISDSYAAKSRWPLFPISIVGILVCWPEGEKPIHVQLHLTLRYATEKDPWALGIWYNEEKNQFSISHIPSYHIGTNEGILQENYWVSEGRPYI